MQIPRKMSTHNVMASILGTRHGEGKSANEVKFAGEESKDKLYEPKHKQKLVRVLTVVAYIISVSLVAIVLSLYYMYIWNPSDYTHLAPKRGLNLTMGAAAAATASTARTPCLNATPAMTPDLTPPASLDRLHGSSGERTTPLGSGYSSESPAESRPEEAMRSLYRILSTPPSQREPELYPGPSSLPAMPSISSEQFQAMPRAMETEDYRDGTIEPADDLMAD